MVYPGQGFLSEALFAERSALLRLRLPLPKLVTTPFQPRHPFPDRESRYRHIIPPHAAFTIKLPDERQQVCYVVIGDPTVVAAADSDFQSYGLCAVAYTYPGLWLTRDPYLAYKAIENEQRYLKHSEPPSLKKAKGLPLSDLSRFECQSELFIGLTQGCFENDQSSDYRYPKPPIAPYLPLPPYARNQERITVKVLHSQETKAANSKHFLEQLRGIENALVFSLVIQPHAVYFQLSFAPEDRTFIERQLQLYFPTHTVLPAEPLNSLFADTGPLYTMTARPQYAYFPLRTISDSRVSPYSHLLAAIASNHSRNTTVVEVFCHPISQETVGIISGQLSAYREQLHTYTEYLSHEASEYRKENKRYFGPEPKWSDDPKDYEKHYDEYKEWFDSYCKKVDEVRTRYEFLLSHNPPLIQSAREQSTKITERISLVQKKLHPWLLSVRITSDNPSLLEQLQPVFLRQFETTQQHWHLSPVCSVVGIPRYTPKPGLVNTEELASLVSLPSSQLRHQRIETISSKTINPPALYTASGIHLGKSEARGASSEVTLPDQVRDRHVYVIGRTRSGKSTLLFNMILQDILRGVGVGVIDPHGDLVQKLLQYIPEYRVKDTIYLNPTDESYPIPLNILNAAAQDNIGVLADDLVVTFRRLSDSWGERMDSVLRSVIYTLLRKEGSTFFDIQRILREPNFRHAVTASLDYPPLQEFWEHDFPQLSKDASQPILHRMNKFSLFPTLYAMLSQPSSVLSFDDVMQGKKILLVNLSQGELGEDNSKLIGSLLVSQIQLAAMRRARLREAERKPFYLYIDEFQNFTSSAFEKILSEAGKYRLSLTVCHQYISQLNEQTRDALLGNVGTIIVLPVNEKDATHLRHSLGDYELADILNLDAAKHEALCRPATKSSDTFSFATLPPALRPQQSFASEIIKQTRSTYSIKKAVPTPAPAVQAEPTSIRPQEPQTESLKQKKQAQPVNATPKAFKTTKDKVLHYVGQAEYLSTDQIKQLCYGHLSPVAQAPAASRDLKKLIAEKRLKEQFFGKQKIYFAGRTCNPTTHNLAIRDLFLKIIRSNFEIAGVDFNLDLKGLLPDLAVSFLLEDGSQVKTFWEYDSGTEGIQELRSKLTRYKQQARNAPVTFIFNTSDRLALARKSLTDNFVIFSVIDQFTTLHDSAFYYASNGIRTEHDPQPQPFLLIP